MTLLSNILTALGFNTELAFELAQEEYYQLHLHDEYDAEIEAIRIRRETEYQAQLILNREICRKEFEDSIHFYEDYEQEPFIDYNECPDCFKSGRIEDNGDIVCPDCGQVISRLA